MIAGLMMMVALTLHHGASTPHRAPAAVGYTVRPGDSLWAIAGATMGHPELWPQLYSVNRAVIGDNPDLIYPGERLRLIVKLRGNPPVPSHAVTVAVGKRHVIRQTPPAGGTRTVQQPAGGVPHGQLGCAGLERLWRLAGGNPGSARLAASIAMAESGGSQYALSPTDDYGYWQINGSHGSLATFDALGNARAAVIISGNGADWLPWTTYTSGAYLGRC